MTMGATGGMAIALQVALLVALVAFTALVAFVLPVVVQAWRQMQQIMSLDLQLKSGIKVFLDDSHELLRNGNEFIKQASQQMEHVDKMVRTIRQWTERADRMVSQVGSAMEPPIFSLVRSINLVRTGVVAFLETFGKSRQHSLTHKE
jgi:uncharacterized protein YoxC